MSGWKRIIQMVRHSVSHFLSWELLHTQWITLVQHRHIKGPSPPFLLKLAMIWFPRNWQRMKFLWIRPPFNLPLERWSYFKTSFAFSQELWKSLPNPDLIWLYIWISWNHAFLDHAERRLPSWCLVLPSCFWSSSDECSDWRLLKVLGTWGLWCWG